jgi:hypothetical protein
MFVGLVPIAIVNGGCLKGNHNDALNRSITDKIVNGGCLKGNHNRLISCC